MIKLIESGSEKTLVKALIERSNMDNAAQLAAVKEIIANVRARGDEALFDYTRRFDGVQLDAGTVRVTEAEFEEAYANVAPELIEAIRASAANIKAFHEKQKQKTWLDVGKDRTLGQLVRPIRSAGIYVPGGKAAYPSSVLMNALPAVVAGVERIIMLTPPDRTTGKVYPLTLVAAMEAGVGEIYKLGGAQAIAAMAFGTSSVPRVDKITGPGNIYVALAKREVYGYAGIDMIAGPSEVLIIADKTANYKYAAADLLSQCEHDELAAGILITDSRELAEKVRAEIEVQLEKLERKNIARAAVEGQSAIVLTPDMKEAVRIANGIAPEHMELLVKDPLSLLGSIENAGAIFMGEYTPEPVGDYYAGPNHVLPTGSSARFFSPLSVDDFMKKSSILYYSKEALEGGVECITRFANAEGLTGHARAAAIRFEEER